MKKVLVSLLCVTLFLVLSIGAVCASPITIDGKVVEPAIETKNVNDFTMVPLRAIGEMFGYEVNYTDATKSIVIKKGDSSISMKLNDKAVTVAIPEEKGITYKGLTLDVAPTLFGDSTYVPLRFIAETIGLTVGYDDATKTVNITSKTASAPTPAAETDNIIDWKGMKLRVKEASEWNGMVFINCEFVDEARSKLPDMVEKIDLVDSEGKSQKSEGQAFIVVNNEKGSDGKKLDDFVMFRFMMSGETDIDKLTFIFVDNGVTKSIKLSDLK